MRDVLERDQEFTVEPYGVEMMKVMSPAHNGGFSTFVLSTDDNAVYEPDKRLLAGLQPRATPTGSPTSSIRTACAASARPWRRLARQRLVDDRRRAGARPLRAGHARAQVPRRAGRAAARLVRADAGDADVLRLADRRSSGDRADKEDGVIPDERQMYLWIKAAFQHFFNNVQKDPAVQVEGLRACRQLLAYLLREIGIQRERVLNGSRSTTRC